MNATWNVQRELVSVAALGVAGSQATDGSPEHLDLLELMDGHGLTPSTSPMPPQTGVCVADATSRASC